MAFGFIIAAGGGAVRVCCGNRLQEQSGWRRAARVWARPRRRSPEATLFRRKDLSNQSFSAVSHDRAAQLLRRRDAQPARSSACWPGRRPCCSGRGCARPACKSAGIRRGGGSVPRAGKRPVPLLFAADREAFAALRAAALQHETAVLGAHPHQKTVRFLAVAGIRLERALALHEVPSVNRTLNVSEGVPKVSTLMGCVTVGVLLNFDPNHHRPHACLVSSQSFPHLWKKLWKIKGMRFGLFLGKTVEKGPF